MARQTTKKASAGLCHVDLPLSQFPGFSCWLSFGLVLGRHGKLVWCRSPATIHWGEVYIHRRLLTLGGKIQTGIAGAYVAQIFGFLFRIVLLEIAFNDAAWMSLCVCACACGCNFRCTVQLMGGISISWVYAFCICLSIKSRQC